MYLNNIKMNVLKVTQGVTLENRKVTISAVEIVGDRKDILSTNYFNMLMQIIRLKDRVKADENKYFAYTFGFTLGG